MWAELLEAQQAGFSSEDILEYALAADPAEERTP